MLTISIQANTVRLSVDCRLDDIAFWEGTFSWQDPVNTLKAGHGEVMTVENLLLCKQKDLVGGVKKRPFLLTFSIQDLF